MILETYLVILPIVLTAVLAYIARVLKKQKQDRDANSKGTMLLLRVQIIEYHDKYVKMGHIPSYAYDNFCEMYESYVALGGNGMIEKMFNEVSDLNLRRGGEKHEQA